MSRENAPVEYEQFMLFGDSITEYATDQFAGYSLLSALQLGMDSMFRLISRVILTCGFFQTTSEDTMFSCVDMRAILQNKDCGRSRDSSLRSRRLRLILW